MQAAQPIHGTLDYHVNDLAHALELLVFPVRQPAYISNTSNVTTTKVRSPLYKVPPTGIVTLFSLRIYNLKPFFVLLVYLVKFA